MNARMQTSRIALFSSVFLLCSCLTAQRIDDAVIDAWQSKTTLPLAHVIDETLTIADAYAIQQRTVKRVLNGAQPIGFKAGLTSAASQARFKTNEPIAGVLLRSPAETPRVLRLSELRGLHIETEVAMRVGKPIRRTLASVAELRAHIDGIAGAVELPNLDYATPQNLRALDIVATNVAAAYFLVGEFAAPEDRDPNDLDATLKCDGAQVNRGQARDALGDQWQAALWLVNTMIGQGWTIEPGQILLTGALGKMIPAQVARCEADFESWGRIALQIVQ